jgi:hypothetical protein
MVVAIFFTYYSFLLNEIKSNHKMLTYVIKDKT